MQFVTKPDLPAGWSVCTLCDEIVPNKERHEHTCDLWEKEPVMATCYQFTYNHCHHATISVDDNGYAELVHWRWGNFTDPHRGYKLSEPEDLALWNAMKEVWDWLTEWEIVRLMPIGPEDSEYFITPEFALKVKGGE